MSLSIPSYAKERAEICHDCDRLYKKSWTYKECGCFMKIKVMIPFVECPLGKWGSVTASEIIQSE